VLSELVDAARPMTHADLFARLDPLGFDRVTLYRNLDTFTEAGILRRTEVGDRTWRYELASHGHGGGTHAHFVCVDCGIMRCLPDDAVMLKSPSLRAQTVEVQVKGHCATCSPAAQR
jgi:Fur family ferric uptake transcriptional regulator